MIENVNFYIEIIRTKPNATPELLFGWGEVVTTQITTLCKQRIKVKGQVLPTACCHRSIIQNRIESPPPEMNKEEKPPGKEI